jgi:hypothetical protein
MSDETTTPPAGEGDHPEAEPAEDSPVGDMTEEGQTELGPHPSLTHLENLEQADLEDVADEESGEGSDQES